MEPGDRQGEAAGACQAKGHTHAEEDGEAINRREAEAFGGIQAKVRKVGAGQSLGFGTSEARSAA